MFTRDLLPSARSLVIAGAVLVALTGLWLHGRARRHEVERRAGVAASAIAGRSVHVHCPGPIHRRLMYEITEGSVRFSAGGRPSGETRLSAGACDGLRRAIDHGPGLDLDCLAYHCPAKDEQAAMGMAVLSHESVHLRGVKDEGATECEAHTHILAVAHAFGLTDRAAQALARWQTTDYEELLPEQYRACMGH